MTNVFYYHDQNSREIFFARELFIHAELGCYKETSFDLETRAYDDLYSKVMDAWIEREEHCEPIAVTVPKSIVDKMKKSIIKKDYGEAKNMVKTLCFIVRGLIKNSRKENGNEYMPNFYDDDFLPGDEWKKGA